MSEYLFIVCVLAINVLSFFIGAKVGQKVVRGETIETPKIEPWQIKTIREYNQERKVRKEIERDKVIAENIDSYNGTPYGQKEIPR